ncbi:MAG: class I SAM-dependent RNA methyltransferase [Phenylobacterium sp.]|nr:class I SAM-dependent RNA methyltransferase [Phenylobacterium sp.]
MRSSRRPNRARPAETAVSPSVEVVIEAVGGEGDGIAAGPLYAPFTLPGERVRLAAGGERRELEAVLEASPQRVVPPCPHFGVCGGCALQHWEHSAYLAWKVDRLVRTLARERIETEVLPAFAASPGSRRRVSLHARPGRKDAARLGFKGRKSWDVIDITACTIADPRLVAALPALRRLAVPLFEHSKSAPTLHVTVTDTGIDVDISGVERKSGGLSADARMRLAEIAGEADFARVTLDGEMAYLARQPVVRLGEATVALPAGGFLQAVPEAEVAMAQMAAEAASGAERIADLFCGSGTFTFRLAKIAPVLALDGEAPAIRALSAALASAPGLHGVVAEARDLTRRPLLAEEMKRIDTVVFDPPRAGAYEQCTEIARSKVARAIAVSCNPATFVRDARILIDAGFTLDKLLPVDQFLWSPHVELVGVFSR